MVIDDVVAACRLTKGKILNRLIYNTSMNKIEKMKKPTLNPWVNVSSATLGAMNQIFRTKKFLFGSGGYPDYIQP